MFPMKSLEEVSLEERYGAVRQKIFALLNQTANFSTEVLGILAQVFTGVTDIISHGGILWALLPKEPAGNVIGNNFKVYLQYYYHFLAFSSSRKEVRRPLDVTSLAFLTCAAAQGYTTGCQLFAEAMKTNNIQAINTLAIDRAHFLTFFWAGSFDLFSFLACWKIIDSLWHLWDLTNPIRIYGFISDALSFQILNSRINDNGVFLFRFSSKGGVAVDYVQNKQLKKTLWTVVSLPDCASFIQKLYDTDRDGQHLKFLVDLSNPAQINLVPKETAFSMNLVPAAQGTGAYTRVDDTDPSNQMHTESDASIYHRVISFMGNNSGGF